jgi:hypothetical protein
MSQKVKVLAMSETLPILKSNYSSKKGKENKSNIVSENLKARLRSFKQQILTNSLMKKEPRKNIPLRTGKVPQYHSRTKRIPSRSHSAGSEIQVHRSIESGISNQNNLKF